VLSIGIFFSLIVAGLSHSLPSAMYDGLTHQDVPAAAATAVSKLPPLGVLFAAFLGYNPMGSLLGSLSGHLPAAKLTLLTGHSFFPQLITQPCHDGLVVAFWFAIAVSVIAAVASAFTGKAHGAQAASGPPVINLEPPEAELAWAGAAEASTVEAGAAEAGAAEAGTAEVSTPEVRAAAASAAEAAACISGRVTGPDGAPAACVTVTALDSVQAVAGTAVTGTDGRYLLRVPAPGDCVPVAAAMRTRPAQVRAGAGWNAPVRFKLGERQ
jgi:hypothetical protein